MSISLGELMPEEFSQERELLSVESAHKAASMYLSMGWAVTAGPGLDAAGVCSCPQKADCRNAGKHAHKGWGEPDRKVMSQAMIDKWWSEDNPNWRKKPVDQVFLVPYLSGLIVADVDNMERWNELDPALRPDTLYQTSGSGRGGHFFYRYSWDTSAISPSMPGKLPGRAGELKFRGIIAAAPSVHRKGGRYRWVNWGAEIPEVPEGLIKREVYRGEKVLSLDDITGGKSNTWVTGMYLADRAGLENIGAVLEGRPPAIFAATAKMAKWIDSGWTSEREVYDLFMDSADRNGCLTDYGEVELQRWFNNALETARLESRE